jgi:hypothetical protein
MTKIKYDSKVLYDENNKKSYHGTTIRTKNIKFGKDKLLTHEVSFYSMYGNDVHEDDRVVARCTSYSKVVAEFPSLWARSEPGGRFLVFEEGTKWSGRIIEFDGHIVIYLFFGAGEYLLFQKHVARETFFADTSVMAGEWLETFRQEIIENDVPGICQGGNFSREYQRFTIAEWEKTK